MQDNHKFSIEVDEYTWTEIGVIACRKKSNRSKIAAEILKDYIQTLLSTTRPTK